MCIYAFTLIWYRKVLWSCLFEVLNISCPFMSVSLFVFGEFYARIWEMVALFIFDAGWNEPLTPPTSVFCAL